MVNGQRNDIFVSIENKSDRNVTLQNIAGSLHHPETNALVKNVRVVLALCWMTSDVNSNVRPLRLHTKSLYSKVPS